MTTLARRSRPAVLGALFLVSMRCGAKSGLPDDALAPEAGGGSGAVGGGTVDAPPPDDRCPGADRDYLRARFVACGDGGRVGQSANAPGATCEDVCCVLGFAGCDHRAAQADFVACNIKNPIASGTCSDIFQDQWSSQCICTT